MRLVVKPAPVCGTCCEDKRWEAGLAALPAGAGGHRPEHEFSAGPCLILSSACVSVGFLWRFVFVCLFVYFFFP